MLQLLVLRLPLDGKRDKLRDSAQWRTFCQAPRDTQVRHHDSVTDGQCQELATAWPLEAAHEAEQQMSGHLPSCLPGSEMGELAAWWCP